MSYSADQTLEYIDQALELNGLIRYYEREAGKRESNYKQRFSALIDEAKTPPHEPHRPSKKDYSPELETRWTVIGHMIERVKAKKRYKEACERYRVRYNEYLVRMKDYEARKGNENMLPDALLEEMHYTGKIIEEYKKNAVKARSEYSRLMSLNFVKPVYQDPDSEKCIIALTYFKHYLEMGCSSIDKAYDMYIDEMREQQKTRRRNEYYEKLIELNRQRDDKLNMIIAQQANLEEAAKVLAFDSAVRTYW